MLVEVLTQQQAARVEVVHDHRIGVFDPLADECRRVRCIRVADDVAAEIDRLAEEQPDVSAEQVVVLAEGGGDMDDAGAALHLDEVAGCDLARRQGAVFFAALDKACAIEAVGGDAPAVGVVEAVVGDSDQFRALDHADDRVILDDSVERGVDELAGQDQALVRGDLDDGVGLVGVEGETGVGRQGPRGRRPSEEVGRAVPSELLGEGVVVGSEADGDGLVADAVLHALGEFVAGERGLAAGTVGGGAAGFVDQAGIPEGLEDPPTGLDVLRGVGSVGVGHVDPERHSFGHVLPLLDVLHDRFAAVSIELGNAVVLDRGFAVEAEHFLDFDLDGQAVSVPATFARYALAAHGLVAGEEVFEDSREHVMDAGCAVGGRRALVEGVDVVLGAFFDRAAEDVAVAPEVADALFELSVGHQRSDGSERLVGGG